MRMHALVVEDDEEFVKELLTVLSGLDGPPDVTVVQSRNGAYQELEKNFFDLIILTSRSPRQTVHWMPSPIMGARYLVALFKRNGTPLFVLTGSPAEDFIPATPRRPGRLTSGAKGRRLAPLHF